jgi:hypothetical protein
MVTLGRTDGVVRRAALGGIAASLVIGLAACGSAAAGAGSPAKPAPTGSAAARRALTEINPGGPMSTSGASKHVLLCTEIPKLTRMAFTRTAWPAQFRRSHMALPSGFTVTNAGAVRRIAAVLCGLPTLPRGVMSCPDLVGGTFHLFFTAPGKAIPTVSIQYSGCRVVTGLGPARTWASSKSLQLVLSQGLGNWDRLIPPTP